MKESLHILAVTAEKQLSTLPKGSCKVDELAIEFDDAYLVAKPHIPLLTKKTRFILSEINTLLDQMSKEELFWTEDALTKSRKWNKVRSLAKKALEQ